MKKRTHGNNEIQNERNIDSNIHYHLSSSEDSIVRGEAWRDGQSIGSDDGPAMEGDVGRGVRNDDKGALDVEGVAGSGDVNTGEEEVERVTDSATV